MARSARSPPPPPVSPALVRLYIYIYIYIYIYKAMEEDEITILVLLDCSKCFDVISHSKLLENLLLYGVENHWFADYLQNHRQQVKIKLRKTGSKLHRILGLFHRWLFRAQSLQNNTHSTTNSALKSTFVVEQVHTRSRSESLNKIIGHHYSKCFRS